MDTLNLLIQGLTDKKATQLTDRKELVSKSVIALAMTQLVRFPFTRIVRNKENTTDILPREDRFVTNDASSCWNSRLVADFFTVDARHRKKPLLPNDTGDASGGIDIVEPRHVVVQVLGGHALEAFHPALQTAVIGIDVLDVVHTP